MIFTPDQTEALLEFDIFLRNDTKYFVLQGGPGVGKSALTA